MQVLIGGFGAVVAGGSLIWLTGQAGTGGYTVGDLTVFLAAVAGVQVALSTAVQQISGMHEALLLFGHYVAVTASPAVPVSAGPAEALKTVVVLHDVWFRYSQEQDWVLRGVDLTIPFGHSVALVGLNGSGKSTIVKLLCRFHEPTRGRVTWDGTDLRDIDPARLRRRISAVFQDFQDYDLPARENIGVGDLRALGDLPRLCEAARMAGVHDTLAALPHGYDTPLTRLYFWDSDRPSGVRLSGGQWQRVALARALLRHDSDLVILDEPSSGLDAEAETEIHRALRSRRAGRTTLLISHRLNTVRDADVIAVLDGGRVTELGEHRDLMRRNGLYARLFHKQSIGYREELAVGATM